jgi:putative transposase
MEKIRRARRNESAWRDLVDRQRDSGLTAAVFCEQEGITPASLYAWRSRLSRGSQIDSTVVHASSKGSVKVDSPAEFIDLGSEGSSRSRFEVRLDLGRGVLLHLVRD